jgi:hypothetical protein
MIAAVMNDSGWADVAVLMVNRARTLLALRSTGNSTIYRPPHAQVKCHARSPDD